MKSWLKFALVAIAFLALAGAAVGIVSAQTGGDATPTPSEETTATPAADEEEGEATPEDKETLRDRFLDELAERLGVSREQLDQALSDAALALVDQAVADGIITEEEAERIRERIEAGEFPFFGFGHRGFDGHGGFHGLPFRCPGAKIDEIAEFLGVEPEVVRDGLQDGQSLGQIAEANGKSRDELRAFLLSQIEERLSQAVEDGDLTQERADELRERAAERIDDLIDREGLPFSPFKFRERLPDDEEDGEDAEDAGTTSLVF